MSTLKEGIRIVSDGTGVGTHVTDISTGKDIPRIQSLTVDVDANDVVKATLTIFVDELDIAVLPDNTEIYENT